MSEYADRISAIAYRVNRLWLELQDIESELKSVYLILPEENTCHFIGYPDNYPEEADDGYCSRCHEYMYKQDAYCPACGAKVVSE